MQCSEWDKKVRGVLRDQLNIFWRNWSIVHSRMVKFLYWLLVIFFPKQWNNLCIWVLTSLERTLIFFCLNLDGLGGTEFASALTVHMWPRAGQKEQRLPFCEYFSRTIGKNLTTLLGILINTSFKFKMLTSATLNGELT